METHFDELLEFPCIQNFKVMGVADEQLPIQVITRLQALAPGDYAPTIKPSRKGNYHALSLAIKVTSKEHMETIYTELAKLDLVRVVL
ncbi:MAG: putative lipoic acid-binding regulatory protein [Kangiellaceae bacterium]